MPSFEEICKAREILGIPEKATLNFIRKKYKEALKKWHPDVCNENKKLCEEKTKEIIDAGNILFNYCNNYPIDFSKEEIDKNVSIEEFWQKKFGKDPLWS